MLLIVVGTLRVPSLQTKPVPITLHTLWGVQNICRIMPIELVGAISESRTIGNRPEIC